MRKLPRVQAEVLSLIANGWELGSSTTYNGTGPWMQEGGLGRGGKSRNVSWATVHALVKRGLIVCHAGFPAATYTLTDAGKAATQEMVRP